MIKILEEILHIAAEVISLVIEYWGLAIITITMFRAIKNCIKEHRFNFDKIVRDSTINHGLSVALEILLAAEIIKTITAGTIDGLIKIILLVVIRVSITLVLVFEEKHKCEHHEEIKKAKNKRK